VRSSSDRGADWLALLAGALVPVAVTLDEAHDVVLAVWRLAAVACRPESPAVTEEIAQLIDDVISQANSWIEMFSSSPALTVLTVALEGLRAGAPRRIWVGDDLDELCAVAAVFELAKSVFGSIELRLIADRLADCLESDAEIDRFEMTNALVFELHSIRDRAPGYLVTVLLSIFERGGA
jgi:hypothetical protein